MVLFYSVFPWQAIPRSVLLWNKAKVIWLQGHNYFYWIIQITSKNKFILMRNYKETPLSEGAYKFSFLTFWQIGILQGPRLMAWTTKSRIRGNPWVPLCPIHVLTFTLILPKDHIQKRRGQALLFSFEYNLSPNLISK